MTTSPELVELAHAHGVATEYEGSDRTMVRVDDELVIAVLGMLDVDATSDAAVTASLEAARTEQQSTALPPTIVLVEGATHDLGREARVDLEDGTSIEVAGSLPDDLPLGWHRVVTDEQTVTLIVAPARMPDIRPTWGWMLQLYALRSAESWGMGDFGDLAEFVRRAGAEQGAGVVLVNPVQAVAPTHPVQRSPYSPASRRFA
ncbi:MAG: 4-alpha-glucanotransferase, partial [Aeromicrobium sp.]